MKIQINEGNGNVQKADDNTTTQIQIGPEVISGLFTFIGVVLALVVPILLIHHFWWPF